MNATPILDVDLLVFEHGDRQARRAVIEGVRTSLASGFVYAAHDLPAEIIDRAYSDLEQFFSHSEQVKADYVVEGSHGQTGYTGLLVETAATASVADWKEMINWGATLPDAHPLRRRYPHRYMDPVFPDDLVPGIGDGLRELHRRLLDLQRRFMRIVAEVLGAHESYFDAMLADGPTLSRAIRYPEMAAAPGAEHVWAAEHGDINLITALPRATAPGLQVRTAEGWIDAVAPDDMAVINTGMMLETISNGTIPTGVHRVVAPPDQVGPRLSMVQFCHPTPWTILSPLATCIDAENPLRHSAIEAGDKLDQVLWDINLIPEQSARPPGAGSR